MYVYYADEIFLKNMFIDYVLIIVTAKLSGVHIRRSRAWLAAIAGGVYGTAALISGNGFLNGGVMKVLTGAGMVLLVFGSAGRLLRVTLIYFAVSAAFAGAAMAAGGGGGVSLGVLAASFAVSLAVFALSFRTIGPRRTAGEIVPVTLELNGRRARLEALIDTGNGLRDPITGEGVTVCALEAVEGLFTPEVRAVLRGPLDPASKLELLGEMGLRRFYLVPYSSLGGGGLLLAFRPERLTVAGRERPGAVAIAAEGLSMGSGHSAIVSSV